MVTRRRIIKTIFFGLIFVMLLIWAIPFLSLVFDTLLYEGYPFSTNILLAMMAISGSEPVLVLGILVWYILNQAGLILFASLGVFKNRKWMIPFSVILAIDMCPSLLIGNFLGSIAALFFIITGNILANQMEQCRLEQ